MENRKLNKTRVLTLQKLINSKHKGFHGNDSDVPRTEGVGEWSDPLSFFSLFNLQIPPLH